MKEDSNSSASLSFLDVIACAFGAIVLLVLIIPIGESGVPAPIPEQANHLGQLLYLVDATEQQISTIQNQIQENQGIVDHLSTTVASIEQQNQLLLATIQSTVAETEAVDGMTKVVTDATSTLEQSTAEEEKKNTVDTEYAGIPVDSEYVAFVIDTSSSMSEIKSKVRGVFEDLMSLYPDLRGIQILNDQGYYIEQAGHWIEDSPAARDRLSRKFRAWQPFSQSDPTPGIRRAITDLYQQDIKMAVFVLGDDYPSNNFGGYFRELDGIIARNRVKDGSFRLHGVAFSNFGFMGFMVSSPINYIILMRELTKRYDGVLVALEPEIPGKLRLRRDGEFVRPG